MWSPFQDRDAGELLALEELEAGAAAGRDVAERGLVEAERCGRRRRSRRRRRRTGRRSWSAPGRPPGCPRRTRRSRRRPSGRSRRPSAHRPGPPRRPRPSRARCRGPRLSAGISDAGTTAGCGSRSPDGNAVSTTMSVGSTISTPRSVGLVEVATAGVELVVLEQALADLVALRLEEREDHAAADQQLVGLLEQVVDHAELVGDLRAAEHHDVGTLRVDGQAPQHVDLLRDQAAHRVRAAAARRRRPRPACGARRRTRRTRTRRRARRAGRRTTPRTASSLLVSPALKRTFSSTATWPSSSAVDRRVRALPHRVGGERDVLAEQLTEPRRPPAPGSTPGRARPWAGRGGRSRPPGRRRRPAA